MPNGHFVDSRKAFDRSIALDSAFAPSYIHMPDLALRAQDPEAARRYIRLYLAVNREDNHAAQVMRMTRPDARSECGGRATDRLVGQGWRPAARRAGDQLDC